MQAIYVLSNLNGWLEFVCFYPDLPDEYFEFPQAYYIRNFTGYFQKI